MCIFKHPSQVCMTYYEHFCFSMEMAYTFSVGSFKAFIHAFYPDVYETSTTDIVNGIQQRLTESGCHQE